MDRSSINHRFTGFKELQPQVIHDLDGEHGDKLGFFAETAEEAERLVSVLQAEGVSCGTRGRSDGRDWHIYKYVTAVNDKVSATSDGCPWRCPNAREEVSVDYSPEMCPRTLDLLSRNVRVGIDQWWTERDCQQYAAAMKKVFDALYTRDSEYENLLDAVSGLNF